MNKKHEDKHIKKDAKKEVENLENQLKKALADYQNLEKRVAEKKANWIKLANKELLLRLLPAIDNLMLAEKHTNDQGVVLSIGQLLKAFENEGIKKIETIGKEFNPEIMECVQTVEGEENIVTEEIKPGYKLYDEVIRPAQVAVGKSV